MNIKPPWDSDKMDKPKVMLDTKGEFSLKTSWEYIKHKGQPNMIYKRSR